MKKMIEMTKSKTNEEKIIGHLEKFSDSSPEVISTATGIFKLQVCKILKRLVENGIVILKETPETPLYSIVKKDKQNTKKVAPEKKAVVKTEQPQTKEQSIKKAVVKVEEKEEKLLPSTTGRDVSKLKFNGELYGKGRLVLAVVKKYVSDNPKTTLTKLKEIFPDTLQPRYGVLQELSKAKKMSEERERFFLKVEDVIKVGDKKIAVSNQFGKHNLPIKHFRQLGFIIK